MNDEEIELLCRRADEFYERGDAFGGSGNLSIRRDDRVWVTPTGFPLRGLRPADMAEVDLDGTLQGRNRPSKEYPFHLALYRARPDVNGIVHLHAPHAVAVSCLTDLAEPEPIPALTPYFVMRVAPLGVIDYFAPGSDGLAAAVGAKAADVDAKLLRNHGLICVGSSFADAADRAIELEETCRLYLLLRGSPIRTLTGDEVHHLRKKFPR